jgi:hypothetical protein
MNVLRDKADAMFLYHSIRIALVHLLLLVTGAVTSTAMVSSTVAASVMSTLTTVRFVHRSTHKQSRNRSMVGSLVGLLAGPSEVSSVVSLGFWTGQTRGQCHDEPTIDPVEVPSDGLCVLAELDCSVPSSEHHWATILQDLIRRSDPRAFERFFPA